MSASQLLAGATDLVVNIRRASSPPTADRRQHVAELRTLRAEAPLEIGASVR